MSPALVLARTGRAEWTRIWTVRSSWIFAFALAVVVVGFGAVIGNDAAGDPSGVTPGSTAWDGIRFTGMFALFGLVAMAAVVTTADHATGGIVPTLQWTPRRGLLLTARTAVVAATTTLIGLLSMAAGAVVVWTFVPHLGLPPGDGLALAGEMGVVLLCGTLLGVGLGLATRSTSASLVLAIALLLVGPLLLAQLPYQWTLTTATHLPGSGALFLIFGEGPSDDMTTTSARLTMVAWSLAALVAGGWRLLATDADR
jgi:ABC-2 type transport system permease protein